ncbi:MAG TPA: sulfite exporter TauE/SafE family protein [Phycisphaerae bacterium]|nr:sulfite exporter TauE/SafE family protein [Phycisphaerae bacterium]
MTFPVSGVEVSPWVPLVAGLAVSLFTSMGGVSGGFLLLPFQVSVLGFTSPAVSPTSLVYNIVAIPAGVYGYVREKRMVWPLTWVIIAGTLPGVCIGVILRIKYLPDPKAFKFFVGWVLLYIAGRLLYDLMTRARQRHADGRGLDARSAEPVTEAPRAGTARCTHDAPAPFVVQSVSWSWRRIRYRFRGETFSLSTLAVLPLVLVVGVVSGAYGIGGGAITGPLLVTLFRLPVYTVAGAVLMGTFISSIAGVIFYRLAAVHYAALGLAIAPDWLLGGLFGLGGAVGIYLGARCQKYVPARVIKVMLSAVLLFLAVRYISGLL